MISLDFSKRNIGMNIDLPSKLLKLIKTVKLDMILLSMQGKYNKLPVASVMLRCINILKKIAKESWKNGGYHR